MISEKSNTFKMTTNLRKTSNIYATVKETTNSTGSNETIGDLRSKMNSDHNNIFTDPNQRSSHTEFIPTEVSNSNSTRHKIPLKTTPKVIVATGSLTMVLSIIFYLGWRRRSSYVDRRAESVKSFVNTSSNRLGITSFPGYMKNKVSDASSTASSNSSTSTFSFSYIDVFKTSSSECSVSDISSECSMASSNCNGSETSSQSERGSFSLRSLIRRNCLTKIEEGEEENDDEETPSVTILETDEYDYDDDETNTIIEQEESDIENEDNPSFILAKISDDSIPVEKVKNQHENATSFIVMVEGMSEIKQSADENHFSEDDNKKNYNKIQITSDIHSETKINEETRKNKVEFVEDNLDDEEQNNI